MTQRDSIGDQLEQLHQRIAQRAHELFRGRGTLWGDAWADSKDEGQVHQGEAQAKRLDIKAA